MRLLDGNNDDNTLDLEADSLKEVQHLACNPGILTKVSRELVNLGLVRERRGGCIIYLALVSTLLDQIISVAVKGPSSSGKSNLVDTVVKLFPDRAYYKLTAMSEKALVYMGDKVPLDHRMLIVAELYGIQSDFISYVLRSLQTEGYLDYQTNQVIKNKVEPITIHIKGPTGLITTMTKIHGHPENETRHLTYTMDDSPAHIHEVLKSLGRIEYPVDLTQWHNLYHWLASGERRVTVPYSQTLGSMIVPNASRQLRDMKHVLRLIQANTLLNRHMRDRNIAGQIIATMADYSVVYNLVNGMLSDAIDLTVSDSVREVVEAVRTLTHPFTTEDGRPLYDKPVSLGQVQAYLKIRDKYIVSRRIKRALESGYLENLETSERVGRPFKLKINDDYPLPGKDESVLPTPQALEAQWKAEGGY